MSKDVLCTVCNSDTFISLEERRNEAELISARLNSIQSLNVSICKGKKQIEDKISRQPTEQSSPISVQPQQNDQIKQLCESKQRVLNSLKNDLDQLRSHNVKAKQRFNSKETVHNHLKERLKELSKKLYIGRLQYAMKAFDMMQIGVFIFKEHRKSSNLKYSESVLHITGCSTILGVPIQNNGKYDGTPCDVITTALMHISHLFDAVSTAMHIPPMHPVTPFSSRGVPTIHPQFSLSGITDLSSIPLSPIIYPNHAIPTRAFKWQSIKSLQELKSLPGRGNGYTTSSMKEKASSSSAAGKGSGKGVEDAAVYPPTARPPGFKSTPRSISREKPGSGSGSSSQSDEVGASVNSSFMDGVMLLRANVLSLCLRVGLPKSNLWPPQALLLNLHELQLYLQHELNSTAASKEAPPPPPSRQQHKQKERGKEEENEKGEYSHRSSSGNCSPTRPGQTAPQLLSLPLPLVFTIEEARAMKLDGAVVELACKYACARTVRGGWDEVVEEGGDSSGSGSGDCLSFSRKPVNGLEEQEDDDWVTIL